ncbi:hypothetical protein FPV67DRAFT_1675970 [Lyophyllum atratum]|nr:hypothetical protein FPV67DRAFT_1675970 [Lyophyllum atratum]
MPPIPNTIASLAGPPLIGMMLSWFLYGILVIQTYIYAQCFPSDTKKLKYLVYSTFTLGTIQTALASADAFHWYASGYGDMRALTDTFISPLDVPILDGILAFVVQLFFCWRIWVLQRSMWLPISVVLVSVASLGGAIAEGIGGFELGDLTRLHKLTIQASVGFFLSPPVRFLQYEFQFWLGGAALADTLIAVIMTWLLLRARTHSASPETDTLLVKIVQLTVETNSLTAFVAIVQLVIVLTGSKSTVSGAFGLILGKLYANTLMVILNNRIYMTRKGIIRHTCFGEDISMGEIMPHGKPTAGSREHQLACKSAPQGPFRMEVLEETHVTRDDSAKKFEVES